MIVTSGHKNNAEIVLKSGGIGVMPTDTIYGIVGSAFNRHAVRKIYKLRGRNLKKPMIVLIGDMRQATWGKFGVKPTSATIKILKKFWPGRVSVVLPLSANRRVLSKLRYLHRGTKTLAFRLPKPFWLRKLLRKTGPLVAPSANLEGKPQARTIREARCYFGENVDFYVDGGKVISKPSALIAIHGTIVEVLRKGVLRV